MLVLQLAEHVFVGQSTIGISLLKLETPYADPHVRCCERCDAKTSAYSILHTLKLILRVSLLNACVTILKSDLYLFKLQVLIYVDEYLSGHCNLL